MTRDSRTGCQETHLTFVSTVLSLRSSQIATQPHQDANGSSVLCWNGEAWSIRGLVTSENDTTAVFNLLQSAAISSGGLQHPSEEHSAIAKCLATVAGPYSFVFYYRPSGKLYFGRDFLGRRSLLYKISDGELILSSVTSGHAGEKWCEVEADGVYCLDLNDKADRDRSFNSPTLPYGQFTAYKLPYFSATGHNDAPGSSVGLS